jgi:hypothetical protein
MVGSLRCDIGGTVVGDDANDGFLNECDTGIQRAVGFFAQDQLPIGEGFAGDFSIQFDVEHQRCIRLCARGLNSNVHTSLQGMDGTDMRRAVCTEMFRLCAL